MNDKEIKKVRKKIILIEKDFFDASDNESDSSEMNDTIDMKNTLQLRVIFDNLIYIYKLIRILSNHNDKFDKAYSKLASLYMMFKDFILNYESFSDDSRKEFIRLFRKEFIRTILYIKKILITL